MNLNLKKNNPAPADRDKVASLSAKLRLHPKLVELMISRGMEDEEKILRFLNPSDEGFHDPMLLKGAAEAADRIGQAIERKEKVVVYGDYDADGICAAAILTLFLTGQGLDVYPHIPNRIGEGYGLNIDSLEKIIDGCCPDLIVTCDCGISGCDEVDFVLDLGVDIIVTDHHEVAERVPQCVVVNPKQSDCGYPCKSLCGAGVALKIVQAVGGLDEAKKYLDLAAIATIADLVPLTDENRLIVQLGLKRIGEKKNLGVKALIDSLNIQLPVTSGDIAFKLAPRVNAAGRMGDAYRAFELLTTADSGRVSAIMTELEGDNTRRKDVCDEMYNEAIEDLKSEDMTHQRAIVLSHPSWEKGITGIVAARLTGDFKRPSFIIVNSGDDVSYKGTSRSIDGINVYELLTELSDLLLEFGGHAQAAGFSILKENIPLFKQRVNEYLTRFPAAYFMPALSYDLEIGIDEIDLDLVRALEKIEPVGNSNPIPKFRATAGALTVAPCKNNANHTSVTTESGVQIFAFNFFRQNQFLMGEDPKDLVLELTLSRFNGGESVKAVLKGVAPSRLYINDEVARANYIKTVNFKTKGEATPVPYQEEELDGLIDCEYGTLLIAGGRASYERFCRSHPSAPVVLHEFMYATTKNNYTRVMVSPDFDEGILLGAYRKIVFLDSPLSPRFLAYLSKHTAAAIYVPADDNAAELLSGIDLSRETFGRYFDTLRRSADLRGSNIYSYYRRVKRVNLDIDLPQFVVCIMVFADLGLINISKSQFSVSVNRGVRAELSESEIYRLIRDKQ